MLAATVFVAMLSLSGQPGDTIECKMLSNPDIYMDGQRTYASNRTTLKAESGFTRFQVPNDLVGLVVFDCKKVE